MVGHPVDNPDLAASFLKFAAEVKMNGFLNGGIQEREVSFGGPERMGPDPGW